jgi:hypothetical protein
MAARPCTRCGNPEIEQAPAPAAHWNCTSCEQDWDGTPERGEWEDPTVEAAEQTLDTWAEIDAADHYTQRAESGWAQ